MLACPAGGGWAYIAFVHSSRSYVTSVTPFRLALRDNLASDHVGRYPQGPSRFSSALMLGPPPHKPFAATE